MRVISLCFGLFVFCVANAAALAAPVAATPLESRANPKKISDAQVRQILIDDSIAAYSGSCPCPYSTARNGSRCGRRSAYSRAGGAETLCYAKDVSDEMVQSYRAAHPEE